MDRLSKLSIVNKQSNNGSGISSLRQQQQQSSSNYGRINNNNNRGQRINKFYNNFNYGGYNNNNKRSNNQNRNCNINKKNEDKRFVRERFLHANCQFILSIKNHQLDNDYLKIFNEYLNNPDAIIKWNFIEEIIFTTNDKIQCPICLHRPMAAKITQCGHIYCWSCIIHYLAVSDNDNKKYRPCPICFTNINHELKSVKLITKENYQIDTLITFRLMKIRKNTILPIIDNDDKKLIKFLNENEYSDKFHRYLLSSMEQKLNLIEREYNELQLEYQEYRENRMPEICFIEMAIELLDKRRQQLLNDDDDDDDNDDLNKLLNVDFTNDELDNDYYYYYYQSTDGQHIYPHSINIRMLKYQYNNELRSCPTTITGKIIDLHRQTITDDQRKRFQHLRHLPLSCEFIIAEIEFIDNGQEIISKETMEKFYQEIQRRKRERKHRERQERIRDRNIDLENRRKYFNQQQLNNDDQQLNSFSLSDEDFQPLNNSSTDPPPVITTTTTTKSFANMLMTNKNGNDDKIIKFNNKNIKKQSINDTTTTDNTTDDDDQQIKDLTLSDYFDQCIRVNADDDDDNDSDDNGNVVGKKNKRNKRKNGRKKKF